MRVFACTAPLQVVAAEQLTCTTNDEAYNILLNPFGLEYRPERWHDVLAGNFTQTNDQRNFYYRCRYQAQKVRFYRSYLRRLDRHVPEAADYQIYLYHLHDLLGNYLFYGFRPHKPRQYYLIEDGILNYYDYDRSRDRSVSRKLLGKKWFYGLFGVPFTPYKGYMTGIERDEVVCQYVRAPSLAVFPHKSKPLAVDRFGYEPISNRFLIIGQESYINYDGGWEYYREGLRLMLEHIDARSRGPKTIYYKCHRYGDKALVSQFLKSWRVPIEILDTPRPVEFLVESLRPEVIASFNSSALINIALSLDDATRPRVDLCSFDRYPNDVRTVFERLGIRILPCT